MPLLGETCVEIELPASPSVPPPLHPSHLPGSVGWEGASSCFAGRLMEPAATDPSLRSQARLGQIKRRGGIMELGLLSILPRRTIFLQSLQGKSNALLC